MARIQPLPWLATGAALAALVLPLAAQAFDPFLETPDAATVEQSPAYKHANLTSQAALAELRSRGILFQEQSAVRGVETPIRLTGRLHDVHVHSALPDSQRVTSPFEICDARLALALDDFAQILQRHDIDEVIHYSMYRPGAPASAPRRPPPAGSLPGAPDLPPLPAPAIDGDGPASVPGTSMNPLAHRPTARAGQTPTVRARSSTPLPVMRPATPTLPGPAPDPSAAPSIGSTGPASTVPSSRHPAGLAIDVAKLHKRSGEWLDVASHFAGHIGARTCGPGVVVPTDDKARELRSIVCEVSDGHVFTYVLTPNYNQPHHDHFHMEIKPGSRWFLVH